MQTLARGPAPGERMKSVTATHPVIVVGARSDERSIVKEVMMKTGGLLLLAAAFGGCLLPEWVRGGAYDLSRVNGIQAFSGSEAAKELLGNNGFVVADPSFKQIFEPYIKSPSVEKSSEQHPLGQSLPSFITTDSAWNTYHVLFEEGVKQLEDIQSRRLVQFSRGLLAAARDPQTGDPDLVWFASVGLALQDEPYRQSLMPEVKRMVDGLRNGSAPVPVPVGFDQSPLQYRAQGFYTRSPALSDYFAARQWYGGVVFRLANARETKAAVALSGLVSGRPELVARWRQMSDPFDVFLARAEDRTIREYAETATNVLGAGFTQGSISSAQLAEIQKRLAARLPLPCVSDQWLTPEQYAGFPNETRGFRLLPPRRLPDAVCFHETTDPRIPGRQYPSGLDFLAASPALRSPAAVRAVNGEFGKEVGARILNADCGPLPDSPHGEAMRLLATLQQPLPDQAPAALRTEAWSDLQLWTQLGAWAEQRHTWALHTKMTFDARGIIRPPMGMVAPHPDFFAGLAKLSRWTAEALDTAGLDRSFAAGAVAGELSDQFNLSQQMRASREPVNYEKMMEQVGQLEQFKNRYYEQHEAELTNGGARYAYPKAEQAVEALARRCAVGGATNEADIAALKLFFDCRENLPGMINDFAAVCDRLAGLAKKSLTGDTLTEVDAKWIENYGVILAGFQF